MRFYEQAGLLPAQRTASNYRVYDEAAVARLEFIGSAKLLGLPLEEIRELLSVWERGVCGEVRQRLRPLVAARLADAQRRIAELSAFVAGLAEVHEELGGPAPAQACRPGCGCVSGRCWWTWPSHGWHPTGCCSFFTFALTATGGALHLEVSVPGGQIAVLDGLTTRAAAVTGTSA